MKEPFGEDSVVMLSKIQLDKLSSSMGDAKTAEYINRLNDYIMQIGTKKAAKYKSHYHTILNWGRRDGLEGKSSRGAGGRNFAQEREDERRERIKRVCGLANRVDRNLLGETAR